MYGHRVKALREAMHLSLRDLSERSGVSAPMLSQVERGETSPTLSVAGRIAGGLDLSLSQLLRLDEGGQVSVVRASERRGGGADGHRYEILTPPLPGQRAAGGGRRATARSPPPPGRRPRAPTPPPPPTGGGRPRGAGGPRRCTSPA